MIIGLGAGGWWFMNQKSNSATSPIQNSNIDFIPQNKSTVTYSFDRYESLAQENIDAKNQPGELARLQLELTNLMNASSNAKNYRLAYILAINQTLQKQPENKTIQSLEKSAKIAANNKAANALLQDMANDKLGVFDELSGFQNGKRWNRITTALEKHK